MVNMKYAVIIIFTAWSLSTNSAYTFLLFNHSLIVS